MNNRPPLPDEIRICEECGRRSTRLDHREEEFPFGTGADRVLLRATVPVWTCTECGEQHTDGAAEDLRHEAVCRHLGRMTPPELRRIREGYDSSQEDWARITGFGVASIKRWETGAVLQNESADRFLGLLVDPATVLRLRFRLSSRHAPERLPVFRTEFTPDTLRAAERFELRPTSKRRVA